MYYNVISPINPNISNIKEVVCVPPLWMVVLTCAAYGLMTPTSSPFNPRGAARKIGCFGSLEDFARNGGFVDYHVFLWILNGL